MAAVATILIKFSHILTIYTQIERKNRYTFKKAKLFTLVFKSAFFSFKLVYKTFCWPDPEPVKIGLAPQHCLRDRFHKEIMTTKLTNNFISFVV